MNWDEVNTLLMVIHQAALAGPKHAKWVSAASDALEALWLNEHPAPPPPPPPPTPEDDEVEFVGDKPSNGRRRM